MTEKQLVFDGIVTETNDSDTEFNGKRGEFRIADNDEPRSELIVLLERRFCPQWRGKRVRVLLEVYE